MFFNILLTDIKTLVWQIAKRIQYLTYLGVAIVSFVQFTEHNFPVSVAFENFLIQGIILQIITLNDNSIGVHYQFLIIFK